MAFRLESLSFKDGDIIPRRHTCEGEDVSPPLRWSDPPPGTKSFALICDDPDAPMMTWIHWVVYGIPGTVSELKEGVPKRDMLENGITQGINSWRRTGYSGPCPPKNGRHRYYFRVFALDSEFSMRPGESRYDLEKAMKGHIIGRAEVMGVYGR